MHKFIHIRMFAADYDDFIKDKYDNREISYEILIFSKRFEVF